MDEDVFTTAEIQALSDLALGVFSSRTVTELADALLAGLPCLVPHQRSFFTREPNERGGRRRLMRSHTMSNEDLSRYAESFSAFDYTAWYIDQRGVSVYRDTDVVSPQVMASSRIYNEWVLPMGMAFVCGIVMHDKDVRTADVTLFRGAGQGDFTNHELALLRFVAQHAEAWLEREQPPVVGEGGTGNFSVLTPRELEVARLACTGMSVREMSDFLTISYGTARRHLANIYQKLGICSRAQLIERMGNRTRT